MTHFPITETIEESLRLAQRSPCDDLGNRHHTFRVQLPDEKADWHSVLGKLVDEGWQLQGTPVLFEATDGAARHILISMLQAEPRPLQIHGELRLEGEIHGRAELRGEVRR